MAIGCPVDNPVSFTTTTMAHDKLMTTMMCPVPIR